MLEYAEFYFEQPRIVVNKINPIHVTDEEFANYLSECSKKISEIEQPSVLIHDVSQSKLLTAEQRIQVGNYFKSNRKLLQEKLIGLAYVIPSPLLQFVLNGIFLVGTPPVNHTVENRLSHAIAWAERELETYDAMSLSDK